VHRRRLHGARGRAVLLRPALVGPTTASILSTVEPLVTVLLVMVVFGDVLGPVQILGGALLLTGVVLLNLRPARLAAATA
jgi:drug/metabolite transporter (DMT)-like permease